MRFAVIYLDVNIGGKNCRIITKGDGGPVFFWGVAENSGEAVTKVSSILNSLCFNKSYSIAAYEIENWNDNFSPWQAPEVFGERPFGGEGRSTLDWLENELIPWTELNLKGSAKFTCGYSLSGLFSLWSMYESDCFNGAVSCSGSLWFPGWGEYAEGKTATPGSLVYLSLGNKEPRTRNKIMSEVGAATISQFERLKSDPNVKKCEFVWENGGHFTAPEKRVASGIKWVLENI